MPFQLTDDEMLGFDKVTEIDNYQCCYYCQHCTLTSNLDIQATGSWKCLYLDEWFKGYEVYEYQCKGYKLKTCKTCKNIYHCYAEYRLSPRFNPYSDSGIPWLWCKKYHNKNIDEPGLFFVGRRNKYHGKNIEIRAMEKDFKGDTALDLKTIRKLNRELKLKGKR